MDPLAQAAGTALIGAMVSSGWQEARAAVVAWWRKLHPGRADTIEAELDSARTLILAARERDDMDIEQALAGTWQRQLQQLLDQDPAIVPGLQRLLEEHLTPALHASQQAQAQQTIINAHAGGKARQYVAGRDLHISGS
jgi:hypothetical protein